MKFYKYSVIIACRMSKRLIKIFEENRTWTIAGVIAAVGVVLVLILFKDEVDRFTFIMPIFAAFIVVGILTLADEEEKKEKKS